MRRSFSWKQCYENSISWYAAGRMVTALDWHWLYFGSLQVTRRSITSVHVTTTSSSLPDLWRRIVQLWSELQTKVREEFDLTSFLSRQTRIRSTSCVRQLLAKSSSMVEIIAGSLWHFNKLSCLYRSLCLCISIYRKPYCPASTR